MARGEGEGTWRRGVCKGGKEHQEKPCERSGMPLKDFQQRNDVVRFELSVVNKVSEWLLCALAAVCLGDRKQGNWLRRFQ